MPTAAEKKAERLAKQAAAKSAGDPIPPTEAELLNAAHIKNPIDVPMASGETAKLQRSGAKVMVGCKLGVSSYAIQLSKLDDKFEQNMQGGRMVKEHSRFGPVVVLRGTAYPRGTPPEGFPAPPVIVAGAAMTMVDKEFWDEWLRLNKQNPVVVNQMVFAVETLDAFQGTAAELSTLKSGLDPVNPKKDDRLPKSNRPKEVLELEAGQK